MFLRPRIVVDVATLDLMRCRRGTPRETLGEAELHRGGVSSVHDRHSSAGRFLLVFGLCGAS